MEEETNNKVVKVVNPLLHKHKVVDFYMVVMVEDQANLQEDQAVVVDSTAEVVELMLVDLTELQEGDHHIMVTHRYHLAQPKKVLFLKVAVTQNLIINQALILVLIMMLVMTDLF